MRAIWLFCEALFACTPELSSHLAVEHSAEVDIATEGEDEDVHACQVGLQRIEALESRCHCTPR